MQPGSFVRDKQGSLNLIPRSAVKMTRSKIAAHMAAVSRGRKGGLKGGGEGGRAGSREDKVRASKIGKQIRWHVNRGIRDPNCELCQRSME